MAQSGPAGHHDQCLLVEAKRTYLDGRERLKRSEPQDPFPLYFQHGSWISVGLPGARAATNSETIGSQSHSLRLLVREVGDSGRARWRMLVFSPFPSTKIAPPSQGLGGVAH